MCKILKELNTKYYRFHNLEKILLSENIIKNNEEYISLSKEYNILKKKLKNFILYKKIHEEINELKELIEKNQDDKEFIKLAETEIKKLELDALNYEEKLNKQCNSNIEEDANKDCIFLEIRSASGGNESSIFAEDLAKMYISYANNAGWTYKIINYTKGNILGYKDIIIKITGENIFKKMICEAGIHRVQRIPITDAHGKIQTSTCTVAILPEIKSQKDIDLNPTEIRIDTFKSSGAGGQHVNVTDSAVRVTHIPTNIVVESQNERSQHKNKANAIEILKIKLLQKKNLENKNILDDTRRNMVKSGNRSEKIRTYNFINNRITDHRKNITIYRLKDIMNGRLDLIFEKIQDHDK